MKKRDQLPSPLFSIVSQKENIIPLKLFTARCIYIYFNHSEQCVKQSKKMYMLNTNKSVNT